MTAPSLRDRIIDLAIVWDEQSIEPAEDFADAVLAVLADADPTDLWGLVWRRLGTARPRTKDLRSLPDGSPTWTEVGILLDRLSTARAEITHLEALLREANDAFDEVTDDYAKELVAGEEWRTFVADEAGLSGSSGGEG